MIAEVELDLAAFANKEIFDCQLKMFDAVTNAAFDDVGDAGNFEDCEEEEKKQATPETSLESLLILTDDSFQIDNRCSQTARKEQSTLISL